MNRRQNEINNFIDNNINDKINELIDNYKDELKGYKYINNVGDFSLLNLKGSIRYINFYNKELRYGGLLIKIYSKNNEWFCILKKQNGKKYYVSFKNNYIFYMESRDLRLRNWAELFISDVNNGNYIIS